jgi:uncharacterized membrane protein (UPF0127 family)
MAVKADLPLARLRLRRARGFLGRLVGLLGRNRMGCDEAFLIDRCAAIHTIGMRMSIDVVFLSAHGVVTDVHSCVRPGRVLRSPGAAHVLELAEGAAVQLRLRPGVTVTFGPATLYIAFTETEFPS